MPSALTKNLITIQTMRNCLRSMRSLTLLGVVAILVGASQPASRAEDTTPSPTPASAASPTPAASATSASPAPNASPAAATTQTASVEDRLASLEAYINNTDGSKTLPGAPGPGHNGWMMTSSALVLFMTLPGLALFYGGLVRRKNALSVLAQCLGITGLVTILWWAVGYSLVFGKSFNSPFLGGSEYFFFSGVTSAPNTDYAYWVSQNVYAMFQLMFAIITPALIIGAIAERMKFMSVMVFIFFWMFLVYFPHGAHGLGNHRSDEWHLECERADQGY